MEKHKWCGECIFCCCVCPECGSTNVFVIYKNLEIDNDTKNYIYVDRTDMIRDDNAVIQCKDCGAWSRNNKKLEEWLYRYFDVEEYFIEDGEIRFEEGGEIRDGEKDKG